MKHHRQHTAVHMLWNTTDDILQYTDVMKHTDDILQYTHVMKHHRRHTAVRRCYETPQTTYCSTQMLWNTTDDILQYTVVMKYHRRHTALHICYETPRTTYCSAQMLWNTTDDILQYTVVMKHHRRHTVVRRCYETPQTTYCSTQKIWNTTDDILQYTYVMKHHRRHSTRMLHHPTVSGSEGPGPQVQQTLSHITVVLSPIVRGWIWSCGPVPLKNTRNGQRHQTKLLFGVKSNPGRRDDHCTCCFIQFPISFVYTNSRSFSL